MALQFPNSPQQPSNQPPQQRFDNSPYLAPQANVGHYTSYTQQYNDSKIFSLTGRIGRVQFMVYPMVFMFVVMLISVVALLMFGGVGAILSQKSAETGSLAMLGGYVILMLIASVVVSAFLMIFTVRRLNDINRSGWFSLMLLLPVVNILLFLALSIVAGTDGENDYGLPPEPPSTLLKIMAGLMIALNVLSIGLGFVAVSMAEKFQQAKEQTEVIAEGVAQAQIDAQNAQNLPPTPLPTENNPQPNNNNENLNTETIVFTAEDLAKKNPNGVALPPQTETPTQIVEQPTTVQPMPSQNQSITVVQPNNEAIIQPDQPTIVAPTVQQNNNNGEISRDEFMKMSEKPVFSDR